MDDEKRSQLNAWFDGELNPAERQAIESLIATNPEARAYVEELKETRAALQGAHTASSQPTPEWSQFQKRLEQAGRHPAKVLTFPRAILTTAAIMVLGIAFWWPLRQAGVRENVTTGEGLVERVEFVETDLEGATPVVYLDEPSGWTVVWVVEPLEEES
jgi:ferric-dicitrate binding protein FerR (iron transport regulator)